jgi:hypothetical protein
MSGRKKQNEAREELCQAHQSEVQRPLISYTCQPTATDCISSASTMENLAS